VTEIPGDSVPPNSGKELKATPNSVHGVSAATIRNAPGVVTSFTKKNKVALETSLGSVPGGKEDRSKRINAVAEFLIFKLTAEPKFVLGRFDEV
jgi:hypothetical protein